MPDYIQLLLFAFAGFAILAQRAWIRQPGYETLADKRAAPIRLHRTGRSV